MKIQVEEFNEHFSDSYDLLTVRFLRNKSLKLIGFSDITKQFIGQDEDWFHFPSNKKCNITELLWLNSLSKKIKKSEINLTSILEL